MAPESDTDPKASDPKRQRGGQSIGYPTADHGKPEDSLISIEATRPEQFGQDLIEIIAVSGHVERPR